MTGGRSCRHRGTTLLEVLMATAIAGVAIALLVSTQVLVLRNYERTARHNTANRAVYNALREIREVAWQAIHVQELLQQPNTARITSSAITLLMPARDPNGQIRIPPQPDLQNPVRLVANFGNGQLVMAHNGWSRVLLTNLVNTTPDGAPYAPFTVQQVAPGIIALHVRLSVRIPHASGTQHIAYEETILLRNAQR